MQQATSPYWPLMASMGQLDQLFLKCIGRYYVLNIRDVTNSSSKYILKIFRHSIYAKTKVLEKSIYINFFDYKNNTS